MLPKSCWLPSPHLLPLQSLSLCTLISTLPASLLAITSWFLAIQIELSPSLHSQQDHFSWTTASILLVPCGTKDIQDFLFTLNIKSFPWHSQPTLLTHFPKAPQWSHKSDQLSCVQRNEALYFLPFYNFIPSLNWWKIDRSLPEPILNAILGNFS
jgi:hypothetical protein